MEQRDQHPDNLPAPHWRDLPITCARGMGMGIADAVPGVSGGTIALILGFYPRLLASIHAVLLVLRHPRQRDTWQRALHALTFLIPLGIGALTALLIGVGLLVGDKPEVGTDPAILRAALDQADGWLITPHTAPLVYAVFFGLVLASLPEPWARRHTHRNRDWILAGTAALVVASVSLVPPASLGSHPALFVLAGAAAISVMLLPGISGSLTLLVLGLYQPVASAVHERDLIAMAWLTCGMVIGVACAVPALRWLLARAHDRTMATLTGLMAGSLVALWPWKTHTLPEAIPLLGPMHPHLPADLPLTEVSLAVVGMMIIVILRRLGKASQTQPDERPATP